MRLKPFTRSGIAPRIFRIGSGLPITPVEATSTFFFSMPSARAVCRIIVREFSKPLSPVMQFAFPEFTIIACARPSFSCCLLITTHEACTWFVVNTPAASQGLSE
ncbi:MAG: hypothetical protein A3D28_02370 [Omnitrophica bacterium RIFCSPHIGHO2_02_FULL_63_14]|nr:MAG: hypothetical protein A3D28_02370 [Omnitrophica bacterium RIFCSPHIGHO2_02_FULL_63_14]